MKTNKQNKTIENKNGTTEIVFILDRSGSMAGLESDTIGGFNSLLQKQKEESGQAYVTTILFDDRYEMLHDRVNIKDVNAISGKEYYVRGSTALYDAIGKTINSLENKLDSLQDDKSKVLMIINTDGYENASREYSATVIKQMITHQQKSHGWEFIFMGANLDAVAAAENIGIQRERAVTYHADAKGLDVQYKSLSKAVSSYRASFCMEENWKEEMEADFEKRK